MRLAFQVASALFLTTFLHGCVTHPDSAGAPPARVLLIGDSISQGYTVPVQEALAGEAAVERIGMNGGPTWRGLEQMDAWLGEVPWDVIHFNFGLHDIKYLADPADPSARPKHQTSEAEYEENLTHLVARLQATGARLIWATTTPVPPGAASRTTGDEVRYNAIAAGIMARHDIPTNDLYSAVYPHLDRYQLEANVHFNEEGSRFLAEQVAAHLRKALKRR